MADKISSVNTILNRFQQELNNLFNTSSFDILDAINHLETDIDILRNTIDDLNHTIDTIYNMTEDSNVKKYIDKLDYSRTYAE